MQDLKFKAVSIFSEHSRLAILVILISIFLLAYSVVFAFSGDINNSDSESSKAVLAAKTDDIASSQIPSPTPTLTLTNTPTPTATLTPIPPTSTPQPTNTPAPDPTSTPTSTPTPIPQPDSNDTGSDDVWERLAQCESGGNWSIISQNGLYFGGLQFSLGAWASVGGQGLPSDASREEQIERGKMLQSQRGWGVWGQCAIDLGLI